MFPFYVLFFSFLFSLLTGFHSISHMNVESCDRLITLHWNFGCWRCSATGHFDSVSLVLRFSRAAKIPPADVAFSFAVYLSAMTGVSGRASHRGYLLALLVWQGKEGRGSEWCFSHAVSAFGTPGHVGLIWIKPLQQLLFAVQIGFLGDTLSVMHEVMDSCLILVALSSRVPWCPSFVSTRGVTAVICKSCHNYPRLSSFPTAWLLQSFHSMSARKLHPWVYPWPRSVSFALQN